MLVNVQLKFLSLNYGIRLKALSMSLRYDLVTDHMFVIFTLTLTYLVFVMVLSSETMSKMKEDEWKMVGKKGNQFVVNNQPFYINGFNTFWLMVFAAEDSTKGKVTEVFKQASSLGMTVCRTWAFNNGHWRALQKSPSVYDEDIFKVLLNLTVYTVGITSFINDFKSSHE
jgi:hypothetical protein